MENTSIHNNTQMIHVISSFPNAKQIEFVTDEGKVCAANSVDTTLDGVVEININDAFHTLTTNELLSQLKEDEDKRGANIYLSVWTEEGDHLAIKNAKENDGVIQLALTQEVPMKK